MRFPALLFACLVMSIGIADFTRAKTTDTWGIVQYKTVVNGVDATDEGTIMLEYRSGVSWTHVVPAGTPIPNAPVENAYIDFTAAKTYQVADFKDRSRCTVSADFSGLPKLEITEEHADILGYRCIRAKTVIRSNQIDVWFTRDARGLRGTPSLNLIVPDGLVLKVVRNGNYTIVAERVQAGHGKPRPAADATAGLLPSSWGTIVDAAAYRDRLNESYVTTVSIFERERISFGNEIANPPESDSTAIFRYAGGTVIARRAALPDIPDDASVFAEIVQYSNGDAYDRTGSVFIIPLDRSISLLDALRDGISVLPAIHDREGKPYQGIAATADYLPPLELVRFITPFGIRFYNDQVRVSGIAWEDSALYRMDVTDLIPELRGNVWFGAFIGNYDKGGHMLSLRLRIHPNRREVQNAPRQRRWVLPLFNTVNTMEMAGQEYGRLFARDSLTVAFTVPDGLRSCTLRYISTGHGGWENGDEFNPKVNEIWLDGRLVGRFVPWRSDCEGYRRLNPASGSFWNGMSSSDFSRSGWCPGAAVNPMIVPLPSLAPGIHVLRVAIPMGAPEGGSFSAWNVSGILLGEF